MAVTLAHGNDSDGVTTTAVFPCWYFSGKFSVSPLKMVTFFIYAFGS
jgi:hypothetical protein